MTIGEMLTRVRYDVNDPNSSIYLDAEVSLAINHAKDEVMDLVRAVTSDYPQANTTLAFLSTDREKAMPSGTLSILRVEYYPVGLTFPSEQRVINFREQDNSEDGSWYIRRLSSGVVNLGRNRADTAVSPVVYYIPDVADVASITSATSSSFTFGPPPANNLIVLKADIHLLAARKRDISLFANREAHLMATMQSTLQKLNQAGARYVRYVPGS